MGIEQCRICNSHYLEEVGSLGNIGISKFTKKVCEVTKYPLTLMYCKGCTLLQLNETAPRELLYEDYWYESHLNKVIVDDLRDIATQGMVLTNFGKGDRWIDIGGNDGTLASFIDKGFVVIVDPSKKLYDKAKIDQPRNTGFIEDYWENVDYPDGAKVITAIACLYDLPDPNAFMYNVTKHLKKDGMFIAQLQTLQPMIELKDIGNICHEHIEYYSYKSLVRLFEQNGLEICHVEKNSMNGGSYRLFARHYQEGSIDYKEKEYSVQDLKNYFKGIKVTRDKFMDWIWKQDTVKIVGYGASTKANTIMQYYNIYPEYIVDVNPRKKGLHPAGLVSKIIDYIPKGTNYLWVFPYGFLEYFKEKEKGYKGKWITTIPEFKIC